MHVLVVDEPDGPLTQRCRAVQAPKIHFDHATTLDGLAVALRCFRYDAVLAVDTTAIDALSASTIARLKQPAAARVVVLDDNPLLIDGSMLTEATHRVIQGLPSAVALQAVLVAVTSEGERVPDRLAEVVGGLASMPSVAAVLADLRAVLADSRSGAADVGRILEHDPGLAAKTLQLANGGFVRRTAPIDDLAEAAAVLGLDALQRLIMASAAFSAAEEMGADPTTVEFAQRHGVASLAAARRMPGIPPGAALGALLLDVGLPLMSLAWPEEHADARSRCLTEGLPLVELEHELFQASHADAGALLARRWSLSPTVVSMIAGHHYVPSTAAPDERGLGFMVHHAAQQGETIGQDPYDPLPTQPVPDWVTQPQALSIG